MSAATSPRPVVGATQVISATESGAAAAPTLMLTGLRDRPGISWTQDTIDNEHLGRRSSKRCCIFHKVKRFGESDSDETDEDEGEGEGEGDGNDNKDTEEDDGTRAPKPKPATGKKKVKNYQRHHA